jgi:hypothetical protein
MGSRRGINGARGRDTDRWSNAEDDRGTNFDSAGGGTRNGDGIVHDDDHEEQAGALAELRPGLENTSR